MAIQKTYPSACCWESQFPVLGPVRSGNTGRHLDTLQAGAAVHLELHLCVGVHMASRWLCATGSLDQSCGATEGPDPTVSHRGPVFGLCKLWSTHNIFFANSITNVTVLCIGGLSSGFYLKHRAWHCLIFYSLVFIINYVNKSLFRPSLERRKAL